MRHSFDPLEWFASLGAPDRVAAVREVVAAFERADPGLGRASEMWRAGKTARVEVRIPSATPLPFGVHLSVQGAEPRLLAHVMNRVRLGDLEFGAVMVQDEAGGRDHGLAAPLGIGSLVVTASRGDLVVSASGGQKLKVPIAADAAKGRAGIPALVGSRFPMGLPDREGFLVLPFEGQLALIGSFDRVTTRDARLFRTGAARVGMALPTPRLMLLCIDIKGFTDGWMEMPFSLAIEPPENRRLIPPGTDGRLALLAMLIDRGDGSVRAVRPLPLSRQFSGKLLDAVEAQQDAAEGYDSAAYGAEYAAAQLRWPTAAAVEREMVAREAVKAEGT